jgi:hypothetical protein
MNTDEAKNDVAKKQLLELLMVAVLNNARKMYIFTDQELDRLFVVYEDDSKCPLVTVLDGEGAVYRALLGTMENRRVLTGEFAMEQECCLDLPVAGAKAHFDLTATHMVVVKITSQPAIEVSRPASLPPPPPEEEELVIDESELARLPVKLSETELSPEKKRALMAAGEIMEGSFNFPVGAKSLVSVEVAEHFKTVPVLLDGGTLYLATTNLEVGEEMGKALPTLTGITVVNVVVAEEAIARLLERYVL